MIMVKGLPVERESSWGLWSGDIVSVLPEKEPKDLSLVWNGEIIPPTLFREILSFFKWTYDEHGCESQVRLYYNPETGEWRAVAMPQFIVERRNVP